MPSTWLLITNATVVYGAANPPAPGTSVLVRDGRINAVGTHVSRDLVPRGEELTEIDATGKTLMPGLIDAHCHMTYGESRTEEEIDLYTSPELRTLKAAFHAQKVLLAGVTGISQRGGSYYIGVGLRQAIKDKIVPGPRMTSAGRYISTSNGLTDWFPDSVGVPGGSIGIVHNTLDMMMSEVRHQVKNGVDLIKLADSRGRHSVVIGPRPPPGTPGRRTPSECPPHLGAGTPATDSSAHSWWPVYQRWEVAGFAVFSVDVVLTGQEKVPGRMFLL